MTLFLARENACALRCHRKCGIARSACADVSSQKKEPEGRSANIAQPK